MAKTSTPERDEKRESADWQRFLLRDELAKAGVTDIMGDDVETLFRSGVTWQDVRRLGKKECPPDLIFEILK